jgi:hypothetical protein
MNYVNHKWASTSILMLALVRSDIDICYSDIGKNTVRLIDNCRSDIGRVLIFTSESIRISDIKVFFYQSSWIQTHVLWVQKRAPYQTCTVLNYKQVDVGYRIKVYSDVILDSALFSPISEVPIAGSVRHH